MNGGKLALSFVTSTAGVATLIGSVLVTFLKEPKDRVRVIYLTALISLSVENFLLAFTRTLIFGKMLKRIARNERECMK